MLNPEDIKQIGQEVASVIEDNINPQFEAVHERLDKVDERLDKVDGRLDKVEGRLGVLESDVSEIKSTMVTQEIFHRSIDALEERLTQMMESEDRKLAALIQMLRKKQVLTDNDIVELFAMPPFAK